MGAPTPQPAAGDQRFVLSGVQIEGAEAYPAEAFSPLYEPYLAREVGAAEVRRIVDGITVKYRGDGYFLAQAMAAPQDLDLGVLVIRITEGRVAKVSFPGAPDKHRRALDRYAAKIEALRPARLDMVERYMMLIDDLPGLSVEGSVKPVDKDAGLYELELAINRQHFEAVTSIDSRGTRAVGRYQALLSGGVNALYSTGDRTGVTLFTIPATPKELAYAEITQEQ